MLDFQEFMLPLLQIAAEREGSPFKLREVIDDLSKRLGLSECDVYEILPGGSETRFRYRLRLHWACIDLCYAGLLLRPRPGIYQISKRGLDVLKSGPEKITRKFLEQYPEFKDFKKKNQWHSINSKKPKFFDISSIPVVDDDEISPEITPEEMINRAYQEIYANLAHELLDRIIHSSAEAFENLVIHLLVKMGYGKTIKEAGKNVKQSLEGGIEAIIAEDKLGLDLIYIQAFKHGAEYLVPKYIIQRFDLTLQNHKAPKGVFITTARFSNEAVKHIEKSKSRIILVDGDSLIRHMIEYNLGVSAGEILSIKHIDEKFFDSL